MNNSLARLCLSCVALFLVPLAHAADLKGLDVAALPGKRSS